MVRTYLPLLLLAGFVAVNAALLIGLSAVSMRRRTNPVKGEPYESGMTPLSDARGRFSIKFYLVAMLFIVFDIETVFMIPWAVDFKQLSCTEPLVGQLCPAGATSFFGLGEMLVFMLILLVGYVYVWKKGALRWD